MDALRPQAKHSQNHMTNEYSTMQIWNHTTLFPNHENHLFFSIMTPDSKNTCEQKTFDNIRTKTHTNK